MPSPTNEAQVQSLQKLHIWSDFQYSTKYVKKYYIYSQTACTTLSHCQPTLQLQLVILQSCTLKQSTTFLPHPSRNFVQNHPTVPYPKPPNLSRWNSNVKNQVTKHQWWPQPLKCVTRSHKWRNAVYQWFSHAAAQFWNVPYQCIKPGRRTLYTNY